MEKSLDLICSSSDGDDIYADFEMVHYTVRHLKLKAKFKCEK